MQCPVCGNPDIRDYDRNCAGCDAHVGYPNVRTAERPEERAALELRLAEAQAAAATSGCSDTLSRFQAAVRGSKAVLCRSIQQVLELLSSDNVLWVSFYGQVDAGIRRPETTLIERERLIADDLLFPHYRKEIRFAALSLDGEGVRFYGKCSVVLSEARIQSRSTVFEKNSVDFCKEHNFVLSPGYRATWEEKDKLAAAKYYKNLRSNSENHEFSRILLRNESSAPDFIEVHIYGPIHRLAIDTIVIEGPLDSVDEVLLIEIERKASEIGVEVIRRQPVRGILR
ncbi:hypothetical protein [uncultured Paludibaculum sp.]|uniref:hypothetical protein n=1 Tax=uncultured Paludibaculum sp. TaxID=1765020 RepID=UPI002AAB0C44|nr:hypothetical protein [uncultured Paludibaculum sp.]